MSKWLKLKEFQLKLQQIWPGARIDNHYKAGLRCIRLPLGDEVLTVPLPGKPGRGIHPDSLKPVHVMAKLNEVGPYKQQITVGDSSFYGSPGAWTRHSKSFIPTIGQYAGRRMVKSWYEKPDPAAGATLIYGERLEEANPAPTYVATKTYRPRYDKPERDYKLPWERSHR